MLQHVPFSLSRGRYTHICNNIANDFPIQVNDRSTQLELLYIDDLVEEMISALQGKEHHCEFDGVETILKADGRYCAAPTTHKVTLGEIVDLLHQFAEQPSTLVIPEIPLALKASRTSSNLNGLMIATIFFILSAPSALY